MKEIQPIIIVPFGFVLLVGLLGFVVAVNVAAIILSAAFILVKWLFFVISLVGGLVMITMGIYGLMRAWSSKKDWLVIYLIVIALGFLSFGFGYDVLFSDFFKKVVDSKTYVFTTTKWLIWTTSDTETINFVRKTWWFTASKIFKASGQWALVLTPIALAIDLVRKPWRSNQVTV